MTGNHFFRAGGGRLLLALLVVLAGCGHEAPPPSYPPVASAKRTVADGEAEVSVSLFRVTYRFSADGTYTSTVDHTYKILTEQAVEDWGATSARWSPWRMDRPVIRATVTSAEGAKSRLEPGALSESAAYPEAPGMYGDERVLRGPLPNVAVGSVIDEQIVTKTNKPFLGDAEAHSVVFQTAIPREKVELVVDLPEGMPLKYEVRGAKVSVSDARREGRRVIAFAGGPYDALAPLEPSTPPNVIAWPHVAFTTGVAWKAIAAAYARVVREKTADARFDEIVAKVVAPSDAPSAKADKLLAWIRDRVRYVGVEFGESSIVPRTPAETLRNGYGDCKDQAVLLVALLRAAGLSPRVALLDAGPRETIDASLPALNVFNHAIVVLPGQAPLWIDPTATRARAGELPVGDQGRYALIADEETEGLTRTPGGSERLNTYREVRQVFFDERGGARIIEASSATGALERSFRDTFDASTADKDKWLKEYVARAYSSKEPVRIEVSKVDDLSAPFSMTVEAKNAQRSPLGLLSGVVDIDAAPVFGWVPKALSAADERKNDFALSIPYEADLVYEIHPPAGYLVDDKPDFADVVLGPAKLHQEMRTRADGVLVVHYRFVLPKSAWAAREVNEFRKAYAAYVAQHVTSLSLVHEGEKLRKARQPEKAIETFQREARLRPTDAAAKMRLANALVDLGFGTTARKLATEAMKLAPNDAELWGYAGYIRGRDTLGRWAMPGWDPDGAIAAYREMLRLDSSNVFAATSLGQLLEFNAAGVRYGPGSKLEAAAAAFDAIDPAQLAAYDNGAYVNNAVYDLMWLGRYEEVRARIAKMDPKKAPAVPAIVAAGMLGGSAPSLAEATRRRLADAERATVLETAASFFATRRRYVEAAALLDAASQGSSNETLRYRANLLRKTKKIDPASMPTLRPEDVVRKTIAICALRPPTMKEDLRPLLSTRDYEGTGPSGIEQYCEGLGNGADDISQEVLADLIVANTTLATEGSDTVGHRVTMSILDARGTMYVLRERSGYQVRSTGVLPSALGCEALTLQKSGRKDAAVQWLTWAKELVKPSGGDDPLRDPPFLKVWTEKKDEVELSAAALCAGLGHPDATVATLNAARAKASGERATILDYALALTRTDGTHDVDALAAAIQLERSAPTSDTAWFLKRRALAKLARFQELRDASAARLAKDPDDANRLADLTSAEDMLGNFKESRALGERWIATNKGGAGAYNAQAWRSLYVGVTEKDLEHALKAVNASPNVVGFLNTLAAVEVALGHTADAQEHLVRSIDLRPGKKVVASDWYVIGRIAEQLGLIEEAKAAYANVGPGVKSLGANTEARLVEARMKALR